MHTDGERERETEREREREKERERERERERECEEGVRLWVQPPHTDGARQPAAHKLA